MFKGIKEYLRKHLFFFTNTVKSQLVVYFLVVSTIPIVIISMFVFNRSQNIIKESAVTTVENSIHVIGSNLTAQFQSIDYLSTLIYTNPDMINLLSGIHSTEKSALTAEIATLDRLLGGYSFAENPNESISPKIYMYNRPEYGTMNFSDKVFDLSQIEKQDWYKRMPSKSDYTIIGYQKTTETIAIAKRLFALKKAQVPFCGVMTVDVPVARFTKILEELKPSPSSSIIVLDQRNTITISTDSRQLGTVLEARNELVSSVSTIRKIDEADMVVSSLELPELGWTVLVYSPLSDYNYQLQAFGKMMPVVIVVCVALGIFFSLALSESVAYPIRKIVQSMGAVKEGDFRAKLEYKRNDEFGYLIDNYNRMLLELEKTIDRLYISELNKKGAELKALQAQINPHFLYNTLDSINWLALKHNVPEVSTMVTALSDVFRYSVSKGQDVIPLGNEVHQLKSYLTIQKMRFHHKLEYVVDVAPDLNDYLIVKLLLQPIVENSIIHGVEKRPDQGVGHIHVQIRKEGPLLIFLISDDGVGADINRMNNMLSGAENSQEGYGSRNVHMRIQYYFGKDYGLKYYTNEAGGVTAKIWLPATRTYLVEKGDTK